MNDSQLQWAIRCAGRLHFVTLALACFTPIPPDWDANLMKLPLVHRRFAIAQNISIGAMPTPFLKMGYALLLLECAAYAVAYSWLGARFTP